MITEKDREAILRCARKYHVSSVYLFGSSADEGGEANDIDLAVEGIVPRLFFRFYGELMRRLSKPVDLVDLSQKSLFNQIVAERGVKIYG